ncbi:MFS transporter [Allosalinactinospora lopnorensis]|uniref:MFS transporter n=1 Tax=Allosalinactinospora lopnorensis TaxID=1352348 RepID=UPI000AA072F6|nr:MFS transporter [Allosalinactinospora lopnorensis]
MLGAVLAAITIPGHLWGLRGPWPDHTPDPGESPEASHAPARIVRGRPFITLVLAFALTTFAAFAVVINLVPLLTERGVSAGSAAVVLGLGGVGQVLGRLGYAPLTRRFSVRGRSLLVLLAVAATTALLGLLTSLAALIAAAVVAGMARGALTLLHATAITDRWGAANYGHLNGMLSAPLTITIALAPWAGAALAGVLDGYSPMFLVLAAITLVGAALGMASTPRPSVRRYT